MNIFSNEVIQKSEETAGNILTKKDLDEERHSLKKTDENVFDDFMHNVTHPFMTVLRKEASKFSNSGDAFVVQKRIAVLTDDSDSEEWLLYYNNGDTWRQSGNALIGKYLKELYPGLYMPGMKFGCKGEQLLLDKYPDKFAWVREVYKKRASKVRSDQRGAASDI